MEKTVRETLHRVLACHVAEIFHDPFGIDSDEIGRLEDAGSEVGLNIWDRAAFVKPAGRLITDHEYRRLQNIKNSEGK